jgi:hypothetical protein
VDLDPLFNCNIDEDFDYRAAGVTRHSFCAVYLSWIQHCAKARDTAFIAGRYLLITAGCAGSNPPSSIGSSTDIPPPPMLSLGDEYTTWDTEIKRDRRPFLVLQTPSKSFRHC